MNLRRIPDRQPAPLAAERLRMIRQKLLERGQVRVAEEAQAFGVSEETIRRDIRQLVADGSAESVFGGAIPREASAGPAPSVPPVDARGDVEQIAKDAIGAAAAARVQPSDVVVIDAGTTALAVVRHLLRLPNLTFVTNSLPAARIAARAPGAIVYVVGGKYIDRSQGLIGPQAQRDFDAVNADWAFLGAQAIDQRLGFASADPYEAEVKRAMIRAARQTVIVADHTKFEARGFATFATPGEIDVLVTSAAPPAALAAQLAEAGADIMICNPEVK